MHARAQQGAIAAAWQTRACVMPDVTTYPAARAASVVLYNTIRSRCVAV